ncbi:hypothetical protein E2C01_094638 [Portunus trituberculatus]|uniref:Uncharacterized protein n=1 Tax=Portunus trituberculatus TaxID=210409 RepID=A0A5B7JY65_PORTR|nr:hypothetical protein [Portunus trituberculatus]
MELSVSQCVSRAWCIVSRSYGMGKQCLAAAGLTQFVKSTNPHSC